MCESSSHIPVCNLFLISYVSKRPQFLHNYNTVSVILSIEKNNRYTFDVLGLDDLATFDVLGLDDFFSTYVYYCIF